jgi:hypothetical protein
VLKVVIIDPAAEDEIGPELIGLKTERQRSRSDGAPGTIVRGPLPSI